MNVKMAPSWGFIRKAYMAQTIGFVMDVKNIRDAT
jgi:hypothetical protein